MGKAVEVSAGPGCLACRPAPASALALRARRRCGLFLARGGGGRGGEEAPASPRAPRCGDDPLAAPAGGRRRTRVGGRREEGSLGGALLGAGARAGAGARPAGSGSGSPAPLGSAAAGRCGSRAPGLVHLAAPRPPLLIAVGRRTSVRLSLGFSCTRVGSILLQRLPLTARLPPGFAWVEFSECFPDLYSCRLTNDETLCI